MSFLCFLSITCYRWTQIIWLDTNTISWKGQKHTRQLLLLRDAVLMGPSGEENGRHCPGPRGQFVLGLQSPVSQTDWALYPQHGEALGSGMAQSWKFRWLGAGKILTESRRGGLASPLCHSHSTESSAATWGWHLEPRAIQLHCVAAHKGAG